MLPTIQKISYLYFAFTSIALKTIWGNAFFEDFQKGADLRF
jgi:hypothetical protein